MLTRNIYSKKENVIIDWLLIIAAIIIFISHALLFCTWIIDDAGISFAYARNLSKGFGLVSQPGNIPIEGYSNFLWVLLLVPFFFLRIFHPVITPKLLSSLLIIVSFIFIYKTLSLLSNHNRYRIFIILILIAINTSFVVWSTSGLENPLYVFLLCLLLFWSVKGFVFGKTTKGNAIIMGLLVGGITITRPEGAIFFGIYMLLVLTKWFNKRYKFRKSDSINLLLYILSFIFLVGSVTVFRLLYFKDIFPNSYYIKGGPSFRDFLSMVTFQPEMVTKIQKLMTSVAGPSGSILLVGLATITIYLISIKRFRRVHFVLFIFFIWTIFAYLLLPYDWMGLFRYATPFFVFFYAYAVILTDVFIKSLNVKNSFRKPLLIFVIGLFIGASVLLFSRRSIRFAKNPTVPFAEVAERFGHRFNQYAALSDIQKGSILLPDVGGTLYYSKLRVYDTGGLCDKTIAKTLEKNQDAFYDYVFGIIKPTFIHTHGEWTYRCKLDNDERFRQDYIPIYEYPDKWVKDNCSLTMYSGDYIRRDAVGNNVESLHQIQENEDIDYYFEIRSLQK